MINDNSLFHLKEASFSKSFCRPLYDSYCFSRIPATISHLLTAKKTEGVLPQDCYPKVKEPYDIAILLLLDGFGWRFFEQFADRHPLLRRFIEQGIVSKITSQFPSTTAAHVTSIHTGLEVGQTGIYEWFYYEPLVKRIISPLLFSFGGDKITSSLLGAGISPSDLFPFTSIYEKLHAQKISSYVVQHESICHTPYSEGLHKGSHPIAFFNLSQGLQGIADAIRSPQKNPLYFFLYFADIDSVGHRKGIDSKEFEKTILHTLDCIEKELFSNISRHKKKVALMVTADHGMVDVNPKTTYYLNRELPQILKSIEKSKEGKLLAPAGSCRDFFLHIQEESLLEVKDLLETQLKGKAEIYLVEELICQGFFGSAPISQRLLDRVGNLVILPYEHEAVWWYEKHRFEQHFYAAHGGLTRHEMETIFLFSEL